jgi:hypothetical protein
VPSSEAALAEAQPPKTTTVDEREHKLLQRECEATRLQVEEMRLANVKLTTEIDMMKREIEQARLQRKVACCPRVCFGGLCGLKPLTPCRLCVRLCNAGLTKLRMRRRVASLRKRYCERQRDTLTQLTSVWDHNLLQAWFH